MKSFFWVLILLVVVVARITEAADEGEETMERVLSCRGERQEDFVPVYVLMENANGDLYSKFERKDQSNESKTYEVDLVSRKKKGESCTYVLKQHFSGALRTMKVVYHDDKVTFSGPEESWFIKSKCKVESESFLEKMENCGSKKKEAQKKDVENRKLSQGILCRSEPVDKREIHIRIDTSSEVDHAEREIFSINPKTKKPSLGTEVVLLKTRRTGKDSCTLDITQKNSDENNNLNMQLKIDTNEPDTASGYVKDASVDIEDRESWTLPSGHRNMKCTISGKLYEKIQKCDVDTSSSKKDSSRKGSEKNEERKKNKGDN